MLRGFFKSNFMPTLDLLSWLATCLLKITFLTICAPFCFQLWYCFKAIMSCYVLIVCMFFNWLITISCCCLILFSSYNELSFRSNFRKVKLMIREGGRGRGGGGKGRETHRRATDDVCCYVSKSTRQVSGGGGVGRRPARRIDLFRGRRGRRG